MQQVLLFMKLTTITQGLCLTGLTTQSLQVRLSLQKMETLATTGMELITAQLAMSSQTNSMKSTTWTTIVSHLTNWPITSAICDCVYSIQQTLDNVSHCRILSPDKTEWWLISATLCG